MQYSFGSYNIADVITTVLDNTNKINITKTISVVIISCVNILSSYSPQLLKTTEKV